MNLKQWRKILGMGYLCGSLMGQGIIAQAQGIPMPQAPKKTIAVADFENRSGFFGEFNLGSGMADMLTDALMKSGQFIVLERQALQAVVAEQNLGASGRASPLGGAQMGDIKRAQILVQGTVTEFEDTTTAGGQDLKIAGFRFGSDRAEAHVAVIIRLVDTTTAQVLASQRVEGRAARGGIDYGFSKGKFGFSQSGFSATPLGEATQIAIDRAVAYIAAQMAGIAWTGKIIKVEGETAYLNAGQEAGMAPNSILMVYRKKGELIDPDTGLNLGTEETFVGRLQVTEVDAKFSRGKSLDKPVDAGDIVKAV